MNQHPDSPELNQVPTSLSELKELRSLVQSQNERIESQDARIESLEKFATSNRQRIRNSKALNALLVVCVPLVFITGDIHFGEKWSGNFKSRDIDIGDIVPLLGLGAAALGVISSEELAAFLTKRK